LLVAYGLFGSVGMVSIFGIVGLSP